MENNELVYDYKDAVDFISERCNIDIEAIKEVLDLEENYLRSVGIIEESA